MIHALLVKVGINEHEYTEHLHSCKPFFTTELTQLEEEKYIKQVLESRFTLDGKYGDKLAQLIKAYYDESLTRANTITEYTSFNKHMYLEMAPYVMQDFPELKEDLDNVVFMKGYKVYRIREKNKTT